MLKLPDNVVGLDFKQHRIAALDGNLITEYEKVVADWMATIEAIIHDTSDERLLCTLYTHETAVDPWNLFWCACWSRQILVLRYGVV